MFDAGAIEGLVRHEGGGGFNCRARPRRCRAALQLEADRRARQSQADGAAAGAAPPAAWAAAPPAAAPAAAVPAASAAALPAASAAAFPAAPDAPAPAPLATAPAVGAACEQPRRPLPHLRLWSHPAWASRRPHRVTLLTCPRKRLRTGILLQLMAGTRPRT